MGNRILMGNVCLLVFFAFLLAQAPSFFSAGTALAGIEPDVTVADPEGMTVVDDPGGKRINLPEIRLEPLTGDWVSTIQLYLHNYSTGQDNLIGTIYRTAINTASAVYGVLQNVYHVVASVDLPAVPERVYEVILESMVHDTVYLSVYLRPPEPILDPPPPGPGPSPIIISDGYVTVTIDTGTASIHEESSTAIARPFFEIFQAMALDPNLSVILVGDLTEIQANTHLFETLLSLLALANNKTTEYIGNINASFPPGAIDFEALGNAYPNASFVFTARMLVGDDAEELDEVLSGSSGSVAPISPLYQLAAYVEKGGSVLEWITEFGAEVTLGLPFDEGIDPDLVAVYQLVEGQLVFVFNQTVDAENSQIMMQRMGTSKYVVLENTREFTDLPEAHWAYRDVRQLVTRQVIQGMTATTFGPATTVTRAQFVTMLQRALGLPSYQPEEATFSDVQPGDWFFGPVEAAVQAGLAAGMGDGTFAPNEPVSRQQMATFMARALEVAGEPVSITAVEVEDLLSRFEDGDQIASWALENTARAVKTGIIRGLPEDLYSPLSFGDRAQAAVMMKRMLVEIGLLLN